MALVQAKNIEKISRASDPKRAIFDSVGDLSGIDILFNHILIGIYFRPERTAGGIIRPVDNIREDQFQGKCGLVLKKGPLAFRDDEVNKFMGQNVEIGDWIVFRISDGWSVTVNETPCRMLEDANIRMKINNPLVVF